MEIRAPYVIIGLFVLATIGAVFGFVYWLHTTAGLTARATYMVRYENTVSGLLPGAAVLFNGIRVGEVTQLKLATDNPRRVSAMIAVAADTPVRSDTKVGLDFQGLTGVPVVALEGGKEVAAGGVSTLIAEPGAGQSMTQAARDALRRVDAILAENSEPLQGMIANFRTFSDGLARNTGKLDGIVAGLERMPGYPFLAQAELDGETIAAHLRASRTVGVPYSDDQIASAAADLKAQADPDNAGTDAFTKRYPKAVVRNFDGKGGNPTEMDALIAYLQMLGTLVDFKLYNEKANLR